MSKFKCVNGEQAAIAVKATALLLKSGKVSVKHLQDAALVGGASMQACYDLAIVFAARAYIAGGYAVARKCGLTASDAACIVSTHVSYVQLAAAYPVANHATDTVTALRYEGADFECAGYAKQLDNGHGLYMAIEANLLAVLRDARLQAVSAWIVTASKALEKAMPFLLASDESA